MIKGGKTLADFPIETFFGPPKIIDARDQKTLNTNLLNVANIQEGDIVLFFTNHSQYFGKPTYYDSWPCMTEDLAKALVKAEVKMVGFDTPSPDTSPYSIHKILLGANILILENLTNLSLLQNHSQIEFTALPLNLNTDGSPVRAIAKLTHTHSNPLEDKAESCC